MTAPLVRVVDHVPFEAAVSPAQALAYCRRMLVGWEEHPWQPMSARAPLSILFSAPDVLHPFAEADDHGNAVDIPLRGDLMDYPRRISEVCSDLVRLGFAAKPSDVLRAMAAEVVT